MLRRYFASLALASATLVCSAAPAAAIEIFESEDENTRVALTGFFQPYYQFVQDLCVETIDPATGETQCTGSNRQATSGFGMTRGRLGVEGDVFGFSSFKFEIESIPQLVLLEAQMNTRIVPGLTWRIGRYRIPYSGQELVSESRLAMDRAEIIRATPGRQLGTSLRFELAEFVDALPSGFLNFEFGVFNGESDKARQPVNNIDDAYLYGGRLEISPFGAPSSRLEGDLRPWDERSRPILHVGGGFASNVDQTANFEESVFGGDLTLRWYGAFLYGEYMRRNRNFRVADSGVDQFAEGWNVQAGLMIPAPYLRNHLEVVARVEYFDPESAAREEDEDSIVPRGPGGGPATQLRLQGQYNYVAGLNWYFRGHDFKIQANYTHRVASEDWSGSLDDRIDRDDSDDTFLAQVTYRF
jgi:hypothetical protein